MPHSITATFNFDRSKFDATGALDAALDVDTRLFVDPKLLLKATSPEFRNSRNKVNNHFNKILLCLKHSTTPGDKFWKDAKRYFNFSETKGFNFGYGTPGNHGSGIGPKLQEKMLLNAKEIIQAGIQTPEILEIAGILEEGIGCDRISDMICKILYESFLEYSSRIFTQLGQNFNYVYNDVSYNIPQNPHKIGEPVILAPKEILSDLPTIETFKDLHTLGVRNSAVRDTLMNVIGKGWRDKVDELKNESKTRDFIFKNQEILKKIISEYVSSEQEKYDFEKDPTGETRWLRIAEDFVQRYTTGNQRSAVNTLADLQNEVDSILLWFKQLVESNGLWELLYNENLKPRNERSSQLIFNAICILECSKRNVIVAREVNAGSGPVDFMLAAGTKKILVELKLSKNTRIQHCYEQQIPTYWKSHLADDAYMIIIILSAQTALMKKKNIHYPQIVDDIKKRSIYERRQNIQYAAKVEHINGTIRASASKSSTSSKPIIKKSSSIKAKNKNA